MWPFRSRRIPRRVVVQAKYDSAQTTAENRKHWANADSLSADAAGQKEIRQTLRDRARYEVANNSYARGIVETLANDTIGTGPRLQLIADGVDDLEDEFHEWSQEVGLAAKLRTMRKAKVVDGEAFAQLVTNPSLASRVKLDLQPIEADRVTDPTPRLMAGPASDGIQYDEYGNPTSYRVLKYHPGGVQIAATAEYADVPSSAMIHWFRVDRPGQLRGLPEIMPALPLFSQLRRYTLAVIAAAETAANISFIMETNAPPEEGAAEVEPMTEMEFRPNMGLFGPEGWSAKQFKSEQPTNTYEMFKGEILNEIARCLNMPFNVAAGNSSKYNYASGRLDHQVYYKAIDIEQSDCELVVLERILEAWILERDRSRWPIDREWFWDGTEHVDPAKEASAQAQRLASLTTTLAAEYARQGRDWERELRQVARERALMTKLGIQPGDLKNEKTSEEEERD